MSVLQFSVDGNRQTFAVGGQVVTFLEVPTGENIGSGMRFAGAAPQILFVPATRVFIAASTGSTGLPGGGPGLIGERTADGDLIGAPFPIVDAGRRRPDRGERRRGRLRRYDERERLRHRGLPPGP